MKPTITWCPEINQWRLAYQDADVDRYGYHLATAVTFWFNRWEAFKALEIAYKTGKVVRNDTKTKIVAE